MANWMFGCAAGPQHSESYYEYLRRTTPAVRKLLGVIACMIFLLLCPFIALYVCIKHGTGPLSTRLSQMVSCIGYAWRYTTLPNEAYLYRLFDTKDQIGMFTRRYETKGMYQLLNGKPGSDAVRDLKEKARFSRKCLEHYLATPQLFQKDDLKAPKPLHPDGLIVKPASGLHGYGVIALDVADDGQHYKNSATGDIFECATLGSYLETYYKGEAFLVQPRLKNHPDVEKVSPGALATLRVITAVTAPDKVAVTSVVWRLSRDGTSFVDNFIAGNLAANVCVESGIAGEALILGQDGKTFRSPKHPVTGHKIEGTKVPLFHEATVLAVRAHVEAFSGSSVIGWDVAITPTGPVLIEGNWNPSLILTQRVSLKAHGTTYLAKVMEGHFQSVLEHGHPIQLKPMVLE